MSLSRRISAAEARLKADARGGPESVPEGPSLAAYLAVMAYDDGEAPLACPPGEDAEAFERMASNLLPFAEALRAFDASMREREFHDSPTP